MTCARLVRPLRLGRRLAAIAVATTLMGSSLPASAFAAPDSAEIERLYVEGQDQYSAKKFKEAADTWTRLLDMLPESGANQATRENILINVLQARLDSFRRLRNDDGTKQIEHLREGKKTLDKYYADFQSVHGDSVAVSAAVQEKGDELEQELAKAEEELASAQGSVTGEPPTDDPNPPVVQPPPPDDDRLQPQQNGQGLIIAGGVTAGLGLIALVTMIPIGVVRGNRAEQDYADARDALPPGETTSPALERADFEGEQANAIAISGGVLGGILLAGGAVMLGLGFKKRSESKGARAQVRPGVASFSPVLGRGQAGFALSGRF